MFDVAVVGASVAGCTAARLYALAGARVALIERRRELDAYKVTCTHAVLSSAAPTIERLGLAEPLYARGGIRILGDAWTPYGGWIHPPDDAPRGWGITRQTLDPLLRRMAAETPGVELIAGHAATRLLPDGVEVSAPDHRTRTIRARLVVGADGRHSHVARMAGVAGRVRPNNRFAYFAYWRGVRPRSDRARVWLLDPDGAAQFPNEDDLTVLVAVAHRSRLPEFREDLEGEYMRTFERLADGPDVTGAERLSKIIGAIDLANVMRPAARHGVAFVGDAALATDPLWGVGVSWAFQSAEWLVNHTVPALLDGGDLDSALTRYRRDFLRKLGPHHMLIVDYSSGRLIRPVERAVMRATARNQTLTRALDDVTSRRRSPARLLDPRLAPHLVRELLAR